MNPAPSIIVFTTLAGTVQGLVAVLALALLAGAVLPAAFVAAALAGAAVLLGVALAASFFHLGHPLRAWRAAAMWRTSWMSREVIVLPAFIAGVAAWSGALAMGLPVPAAVPLALLALCALLWLCTAMIYASLRFVREWAHPLTVLNYALIGLMSGCVLAGALAVAGGQAAFAAALLPWSLAATAVAAGARALACWRNAHLAPRSTLQSATGLRSTRVVQQAMGFTGTSFNTREFFHGASPATLQRRHRAFWLLGFALPGAAVLALAFGAPAALWALAVPVQALGLLAERWCFFADARHPQNLYYQTAT